MTFTKKKTTSGSLYYCHVKIFIEYAYTSFMHMKAHCQKNFMNSKKLIKIILYFAVHDEETIFLGYCQGSSSSSTMKRVINHRSKQLVMVNTINNIGTERHMTQWKNKMLIKVHCFSKNSCTQFFLCTIKE